MKPHFAVLLTVSALLTTSLLVAQVPAPSLETRFKAAIHAEEIEGNLEKAIVQYAELSRSGDRPVAARALLRLAECYRKLGDARAVQIYQRIVREYTDQPEVVRTAGAYLTGGEEKRPAATTALRKIWAGPQVDTTGHISVDGRYLSYTHWETGDLAVRDLTTGRNRLLTNKGSWLESDEFAETSAISRDGKRVAYAWFNGKDRYEMRVIAVDKPGFPEPRTVFDNPEVVWANPHDWSPDGQWVAVALSRVDNTQQVGLINVGDGSLRVLKSVDWRGVTRLAFSPDGRYVGFDLPAGEQITDETDVFVMAVDGSRSDVVAPGPGRDDMIGWSPDGTRVLFTSTRGGSRGLWAQRIREGKPEGTPELVKPDIGGTALGISDDGRLFFGVSVGDRDIHIAEIDFETGKLVTPPVRAVRTFLGTSRQPAWSRDGKHLSYVFGMGRLDTRLAIRSNDTDLVRQLPPKLVGFYSTHWAPDGASLLVQGTSSVGRAGLYSVNVENGDATLLIGREPGRSVSSPRLSRDGRRLFHVVREANQSAIVERDMVTGTERTLYRAGWIANIDLAPDDRHLVLRQDPAKGASAILVVSVVGTEAPRELVRVNAPLFFQNFPVWTAAGDKIIAVQAATDGRDASVLLIPAQGGTPTRLDLAGFNFGPIAVHPDGRRIAYLAGKLASEVWVLENFVRN